MTPTIPTENVHNTDGTLRVSIAVSARLWSEMERFGITVARLSRHTWKRFRIPRRRVEQALRGEAGHLGKWTSIAERDWIEMIRGAWTA